ncbi:MAG: hypothetical protein ABW128_15575 [Rhizorhabdus sp.]
MNVSLVALVVSLILIAALVWAEGLLPFDATMVRLIQALTAIVGILLIAQRAGVV